jgi:hypothetical protein
MFSQVILIYFTWHAVPELLGETVNGESHKLNEWSGRTGDGSLFFSAAVSTGAAAARDKRTRTGSAAHSYLRLC